MTKRFVVVPATVTVTDRVSRQPVLIRRYEGGPICEAVISHADFVLDYLTSSLARGGGSGLRRKKQVENLFENCKQGDVIGIDLQDYEVMRKVLDSLAWDGIFGKYADQLLPHFEAWESAALQDEEWRKQKM